MEQDLILNLFTSLDLTRIVLKILNILFSLGFFAYSFIFYQQVKRMTKNYQMNTNRFLITFSILELFISFVLIFTAFFLT